PAPASSSDGWTTTTAVLLQRPATATKRLSNCCRTANRSVGGYTYIPPKQGTGSPPRARHGKAHGRRRTVGGGRPITTGAGWTPTVPHSRIPSGQQQHPEWENSDMVDKHGCAGSEPNRCWWWS